MNENNSPNELSKNSEEHIPRSVKRKHEISDTTIKPDLEPVEKRQAFKLTPPTLIHGVAKPAPNHGVVAEGSKKTFLRPSRLVPPVVSQSTSQSTNTVTSLQSCPVGIHDDKLPSGIHALSNNPFLKPITEEDSSEQKNDDSQTQHESNGCSEKSSHGTSDAQENSLLKMTSEATVPNSDSQASSETAEFVFGRKMEDRVMKSGTDSGSTENKTPDFVFGANLSERVKMSTVDSSALQTAPAESAIFLNDVKQDSKASVNRRELEKNAAVLFSASNTKVVMPEVEIKTGEEDEKNVLQIQCKLYQYDSSNSKNWIERGRGNLRLNDLRISAEDQKFQSRLVMRTNGSLRLILNTKIWATMVVERADTKSVRISAQTEEGEIGVFLIMAPINDADHLFRAIEYRVLHLKQLEEEKCKSTSPKESDQEKSNDPIQSELSQDALVPDAKSTTPQPIATEETVSNNLPSLPVSQTVNAEGYSTKPSPITSASANETTLFHNEGGK